MVFVMTLAGAGTFWYQHTATVCPTPISYRVGEIDAHFNTSKEDVIAQLKKAEAVWEEHAGRDLFYYDENGTLPVNFIFDERQALADSEITERQALDEQKEKNDVLTQKINELQKEYESRTGEYQGKVTVYERDLSEYNETVARYNDQGGAPQSEFEQLEREKERLAKTSQALNQTADDLNNLANKINQLGDEANKLVEVYNQDVERYNDQYGYSREFTQGDYEGDRINIYKFSDEHELELVLVHEFGHALGLDHVEGESSVMYYLLGDTSAAPVLSKEDQDAFATVCGQGSGISHDFRRFVRTVLTAVNF
ncbi:MAG: hypothetical protein RL538_848 [Candidatus Parcubacteria bacterium]